MLTTRASLAAVLLLSAAPGPSLAQGSCPGLSATEEAVLQPLVPATNFGLSVSLSGDWAVVGTQGDGASPASGEATFFERVGPSWVPRTSMVLRRAPRVDGDVAVISQRASQFSADALERSGSTWNSVQTLSAPGVNNHDDFGFDVALDGDTAALSAPGLPGPGGLDQGGVLVFDRVAGTWVFRTAATDPNSKGLGRAIDLDGRWLAATSGPAPWLVTVFDLSIPGSPFLLLNPGLDDFSDVAVSGDTLVIGASDALGGGLGPAGKVYVFEHLGGTWVRGPELQPTDLNAGAGFGAAVDLDGDRLLVGAPRLQKPSGLKVGGFYVFERVGTTWVEVGRVLGSAAHAPNFGSAVCLAGDRAVIGASGEARVYELLLALPATAYCTAGTTASGCQARISATGIPSASAATGFVVHVSGSEGQKDGTLYFGTGGPQANAWGNGSSFQCVEPPVTRTGILQGSGAIATCTGTFQLEFAAWMTANPARAPQPGTTAYMQTWFRDPLSTSNQSTSLSDALVFTVCP